jgi:TonB-linked SusC/RagA family outer membrane protein
MRGSIVSIFSKETFKCMKFNLQNNFDWCKIMKITFCQIFIVITFTGLSMAKTSRGQEVLEKRFDLEAQDKSLKKVLQSLEKQTHLKFMYRMSVLDNQGNLSLDMKQEKLSDILNSLFGPRKIAYHIIDEQVVLTKLPDVAGDLPSSPSAVTTGTGQTEIDQHITGIVRDSAGAVLPGVTVKVKGTDIAASTNEKGGYSIQSPDNAILVFTFLGMEPLEVSVTGKKVINVTLKSSSALLKEIIVVGYGTQSKAKLTGAVNTIAPKLIVERPVTSLNNALQGVVPGLTVLARPGDVGSDIAGIAVRGKGNLGSPEPLYVVDGIIISSDDFARIRPADVASMSILKDASSASIYGSRAANGVILVTTKKGTAGKSTVTLSSNYGVQSAVVLPNYLGSYDFATLRNEALTNAGRAKQFSDDQLAIIKSKSQPDLYPDNDWYKLVLRQSVPLIDNQVSVSGGGKTRYYASGGYMDQHSLFPGKSLQRYTLRANTQSEINKILTVGTNFSFVRDGINNSKGTLDAISWLARMVPMAVNKQSDGNWGSVNAGSIDATIGNSNPNLVLDEGGRSSSFTNRVISAVNASVKPMSGLSIDATASYNVMNSTGSVFKSTRPPLINFFTKETLAGTGVAVNSLNENWNNSSNLLTQATVSYLRNFGAHEIKILGGTSYEYYNGRAIGVLRNKFPGNDLDAINAGSTDPANTTATGTINTRSFVSYFGRLNYSFEEKYLFEGDLRRDESSQFAPGHRAGIYPAASIGWRISQESFLKNVSWISELKLRGSWGLLGNVSNVGYYDYYGGISTGKGAFLGGTFVDGAWPGQLASPNLTWEEKEMKDIGFDASLFSNKLSIQVDAYDAMTKNILLSNANSIPQEAGINLIPSVNAGKVRNRGIELTLNYSDKIGQVNYSIGGNFTRIWNKIVDLNGLNELPPSAPYINRVGQAVGSFYTYQAAGLFTTPAEVAASAFQANGTAPGDIKYVDQNGDHIINDKDRVITGNDVPYKYYGVNLFVAYKGFDLSVIGQGVLGVKTYLNSEASQAFFNGAGVREWQLGRWTATDPNPNAVYPRILSSENNTQNMVNSSFWLFDASYFRVKSLTLGYTLPINVSKRIGASTVKIYFTTNNLFTIRGDKRMKDFDPEAPTGGASYPQLKTNSLGVNFTF